MKRVFVALFALSMLVVPARLVSAATSSSSNSTGVNLAAGSHATVTVLGNSTRVSVEWHANHSDVRVGRRVQVNLWRADTATMSVLAPGDGTQSQVVVLRADDPATSPVVWSGGPDVIEVDVPLPGGSTDPNTAPPPDSTTTTAPPQTTTTTAAPQTTTTTAPQTTTTTAPPSSGDGNLQLAKYDGSTSISGSGTVDANRMPTNPWRLRVGSVTFTAGKDDANPKPGYIVTGGPANVAGNVDPIVNPDGSPSMHSHQFFGVDGFSRDQLRFLTTRDILERGTFRAGSRLVVWIPTASVPLVNNAGGGNTGYVENKSGGTVAPLPQGLKLITDNCYWKDQGGNWSLVCVSPEWWDGRNLDSANHRSHLSFSRTSTHTVRLPQVRWHFQFDAPYSGPRPVLSSEAHGTGPHMDVWIANDPRVERAFADHLYNAGRTMGRMTAS